MSEIVHIVCLDAPAPPDYGGAIDMYYKMVALAQKGKRLILHYFDYKKGRNIESLKPYCYQLYSYERSPISKSFLSGLPYIVSSRINQKLIDTLNKDDHPVIVEGIHCTGIISFLRNKNRKIIVRVHNDEAEYYKQLVKTEKSFLKRLYLRRESRLLARYQHTLPKDVIYAALSKTDNTVLKDNYGLRDVRFLPSFTSWQKLSLPAGLGKYCLYHGNMSVSENEAAAQWLIEHVFSKMECPFIIAGKNISEQLKKRGNGSSNISFSNNPSMEEMNSLISEAQIHVLPSMNNTGVKLKVVHALFEGRFCITNNAGVAGSSLEGLVHIANTPEETRQRIKALFTQPLTQEETSKRGAAQKIYNNSDNAALLIAWLS